MAVVLVHFVGSLLVVMIYDLLAHSSGTFVCRL